MDYYSGVEGQFRGRMPMSTEFDIKVDELERRLRVESFESGIRVERVNEAMAKVRESVSNGEGGRSSCHCPVDHLRAPRVTPLHRTPHPTSRPHAPCVPFTPTNHHQPAYVSNRRLDHLVCLPPWYAPPSPLHTHQLASQKQWLRDQYAELEKARTGLEADKAKFEAVVEEKWIKPNPYRAGGMDRRIKLNVGGQMFEATAKVKKGPTGDN